MTSYYQSGIRVSLWISFLTAGLLSGVGLAYQVNDAMRARPATPPAAVVAEPAPAVLHPATYNTYVFILLDSLSAGRPIVDAVWLALIPSDQSAVQLIGVPPAALREHYTHEDGLAMKFLKPYVVGAVAGTVALDRAGLITLIDRLDGVWLGGRTLRGAEVANFVVSPGEGDAQEVMLRQGAVVASILAKMAVSGAGLDLAGLLETPMRSTVAQERVLDLIDTYYPFQLDSFRVRPILPALN